MIEKLKQFFTMTLADESDWSADPQQTKLLAAVALMIEIIAVDNEQHDSEKKVLRDILATQFNMATSDIEKLISQAEAAHKESTDFYRFTAEINQYYDADEKVELIENLWRLAWADHVLDDLEEHVIRKLASLLYVSHKDFIATKLRVIPS